MTRFKTTLSGPEYAQRFIDQVESLKIPYITGATVLEVSKEKIVTVVTREGIKQWKAQTIILTMGCRERTRGALGIPGERPTGVFTAGVAQAYVNLYDMMPAKEVVILGSGDIGMIMARRLSLEGAHVQAVVEIQPYPSGLPRNVEQCLNDYDIPLYLNHTVTQIHGDRRLEGVTVSQVDDALRPIIGTEKRYYCDTLILSVGLIPDNEVAIDSDLLLDGKTKGAVVDEFLQTSIDGIFAAGNVLHVHDLVDFVSLEAEKLANSVISYLQKGELKKCPIELVTGEFVNHTIPQKISGEYDFDLSLRVNKPLKNCRIVVKQGDVEILSKPMKKALPAEMIQLHVKSNKIQTNQNLEVSVIC